MADVFFKTDANMLLEKKHIVFFGDSNARALYKDLIWLLNCNQLIPQNVLGRKQESSVCGDKLGRHSHLIRGRDYEEERSYRKGNVKVDFYFMTRCFSPVFVHLMEDIHLGVKDAPDAIYMNSTLWDLTRWGPDGVIEFKDNLQKLARMFKSSLPTSTLVIWATTPPVSKQVRSSLLIKQIDFLRHTLRFDIVEANQFARQVMVNHGFDVLDSHYYMRMQIHRRAHDGVHYFPTAVRFLTNLLLTHIALSWNKPLPNRVKTILLDKSKAICKSKSKIPPSSNPKNKLQRPPLLPTPSPLTIDRRGLWRGTPYQRSTINFEHEGQPSSQERFRPTGRVKGGDRRNINQSTKEFKSSGSPPLVDVELSWSSRSVHTGNASNGGNSSADLQAGSI